MPTEEVSRLAPAPAVLAANAILAGATLGLQVALTRHFSFLYWHHFAFMIIGIGMLGFGAAGAWLSRRGGIAGPVEAREIASRSSIVAVLAILAYLLLAPSLRFEPLDLLSKPMNLVSLLALYVLILVPFVALGIAQGALLAGYPAYADRVYGIDLIGAGAGCLATLALLQLMTAPAALLGCAAAVAASSLLLARGTQRAWSLAASATAIGLLAIGWADTRPFVPAPSKDLGAGFAMDGRVHSLMSRIEYRTSSAAARLDVTAPLRIPFAFGGDVASPAGERVLPGRVVFQDAAAPTYLFGVADLKGTPYLGLTNQGLAYQIRQQPRVLVIGAGGGPDLMIALHHGADSVTAVELNPQMLALGRDRYAEFLKGLYQRPDVHPIISEGRHFLARSHERFDVIQMSGVDTFAALASGAYAMSENYLYTVEAGVALLDSLEPNGVLTISRWWLDPPRETLRLVNVLAESMRRIGIENPGQHLFVVRADAWETTLAARAPFSAGELATLRAWVAERGWTIELDPSGDGEPSFVASVHGSPAERAAFLDSYQYNVTPVTDDDPFFFDYYRWRNLFGSSSSSGGYIGYRVPAGLAVALASLLQMVLLSALFVLAPLWSQRSQLRNLPGAPWLMGFFAALGVGFMAIEITSIQMFTVFLGHPIYSMAVTLTALLIATGIGSWFSGRVATSPDRLMRISLLGVTVWVVGTALLPRVLDAAIVLPLPVRALLVALWLLPVGVPLGTIFPTAIRTLENRAAGVVAWAWGVNACFSVIASAVAMLVAMEVGFRATLLLAVAVYWAGHLAWLRSQQRFASHALSNSASSETASA